MVLWFRGPVVLSLVACCYCNSLAVVLARPECERTIVARAFIGSPHGRLVAVRLHGVVTGGLFLHGMAIVMVPPQHPVTVDISGPATLASAFSCDVDQCHHGFAIQSGILPPTCDAANLLNLLPNSHSLACACPS